MSQSSTVYHTQTFSFNDSVSKPDPHQETFPKTIFGFWIYLMTDCLLFATFFCTYAVLQSSTFGGPTAADIFKLSTAFTETILLLISSITSGFCLLAASKNKINQTLIWLVVTFLLGSSFLGIELYEFKELIAEGNSWTKSAFLSSFFALVSTHGLHISFGLFWIVILIGQLLWMGIINETFRRLVLFSMFWHFLDIVWIFIFTFVYLLGVA